MSNNGYVRQSAGSIITGATILAAHFNNEYNALATAFDGGTGHDHSGGVGLGPQLSLATAVTGILPFANGGTGAALTASNGGILYSTGSVAAILAGTATASQVLLSGSSTTPAWSTATYPATTTVSQLLYSSSANVITGLATANSGVLITSAGGVPSISSTLPSAVQANITATGTVASGTWGGTIIGATYGGTGVNNGSNTITLGGAVSLAGAFTTAGALSTAGAFALTLTTTASTNVTLPTSGTLVNTAVSSLSSLTSAAALTTVGTIGTGIWQGTAVGVAYGGTGLTTLTLNNVILGNGTSTPQFIAPGTSGNVLTSNGTTWTSAAISATAAAGTLTGTTLASNVVASSLTSLGTIGTGVWQGTKIGLAYGGTNADLSATGGTSQVLKQVSSGAAITVGQLAFTDISGTVTGTQLNTMSAITNSLSGDVSLNNTSNYFDGPSVAQGISGTWFVSGTVTVSDATSSQNFISAKLWDGTTIIASAQITIDANFAISQNTISLSGFITSPAANLRISVKDVTTTSGKILFNASGNSKDSTITAIRIG